MTPQMTSLKVLPRNSQLSCLLYHTLSSRLWREISCLLNYLLNCFLTRLPIYPSSSLLG